MAQVLSSSAQPTDVYGGDEIAALVLDPGYSETRAGFAGEDVPRAVYPSSIGYIENQAGLRFGHDGFVPKQGLEIGNYMNRDSVVEDWESATLLWEDMLTKSLHVPTRLKTRRRKNDGDASQSRQEDGEGDVAMGDGDNDGNNSNNPNDPPAGAARTDNFVSGDGEEDEKSAPLRAGLEESPLLMSEAPWNPTKAREKTAEIIVEQWDAPAFWLTRTPVLAAFAAGRATALVIDVGASNTSVTALHDGTVLKKSIQRSPAGGIWLSAQIRSMLSSQDPRIEVVPTYKVAAKRPVDAGAPAQARLVDFGFPISDSFHAYEEDKTLKAFKESVVEVWHQGSRYLESPANEEYVASQPGPVFEFPGGSNQMWREPRYRVVEGMFDANAQYPILAADAADDDIVALKPAQTVPEMVRNALGAVDADLRGNLLANVVVTGGTSLVRGFTDRLHLELSSMYPAMRIRIQAAGHTTERRFGAWIGGSILASLGSFHQMWVSKKEYEEHGANVVEKRCK